MKITQSLLTELRAQYRMTNTKISIMGTVIEASTKFNTVHFIGGGWGKGQFEKAS